MKAGQEDNVKTSTYTDIWKKINFLNNPHSGQFVKCSCDLIKKQFNTIKETDFQDSLLTF